MLNKDACTFRSLEQTDIAIMFAAFAAIGWNKPTSLFQQYFDEQSGGKRHIWVAYSKDEFVGYVTLKLESEYSQFNLQCIPEINDLNVLPEFRRRGIASKLLELAENEALKRGFKQIGLGVGLYSDYGPAQRLYVKRGYVPDGHGITYKNKQLLYGDTVKLDDDLVLWLVKEYCFTFKPVEKNDLPLLYTWFKKTHVELWWPVPDEQEDFFKSFLERIRAGVKKPYIVLLNDLPIGYIQSYSVDKTTHSWLPKLPSDGNVIGIDQFIGEPDYLYKGFGPLFIKQFVDDLIAKDPSITVVVDPDPTNSVAIRCYEKVGFKQLGVYQAPWGPALVMTHSQYKN